MSTQEMIAYDAAFVDMWASRLVATEGTAAHDQALVAMRAAIAVYTNRIVEMRAASEAAEQPQMIEVLDDDGSQDPQ